MKTLADLIARHHPSREGAVALIEALEMVIEKAESWVEDFDTGIERGYYEGREADEANLDALRAALKLVDD